jgi:deoxyribonuclease V
VIKQLHRWDLTPREAIEVQRNLSDRIHTRLILTEPSRIAGVDVAYKKDEGQSVATVAVLAYPSLELVESSVAKATTPFPYVPGLLSFREIPPILEAIQTVSEPIDMILVDGHGRAHPRRIGIASHLGIWLEKPTIGIGKSRLCGSYQEPGQRRGSQSELVHQGEVIGKTLRTRTGVKPVFVSVGFGIPLEQCIEWTLRVTLKYRLPEPIRFADRLAARYKD